MAEPKPIEKFADAAAFRRWLNQNHATHDGIRMKIAKKAAAESTCSYDEALDVALAFGWIDGQKWSFDENFFLQGFTRRRPRSIWSKRNVDKVAELMLAGQMEPSGLAEVDAAKADGRWERAYKGTSAAPPPDFLEALAKSPKAEAFYATLNSANRFAVYFRVQNSKKPETRARNIAKFVDMLERGEKLH